MVGYTRMSMEANYEIVLRRELDSREVGGSDRGRMSELMNKMDSVLETMVMRATSNEMDPDARNDDVQFDLHDEEEDIVLPFPDVEEGTAQNANTPQVITMEK